MSRKIDDEPATRRDLKALQGDFAGLRADVDGLRTDVDGLRVDVDGIRTEVGDLRTDLRAVESRLDKKIDGVAALLIRTRAEMATKSDLLTLETKMDCKFDRVFSSLDLLLAERESNRRSFVVWDKIMQDQAAILAKHENRITVLEARPAA